MSRRNTGTQASWKNLVWVQGMALLALTLLFSGLGVMSVASYIQTEMAFLPMNDPNVELWGIKIGNLLSHAMAMIFQYGQNAVLLYRVFQRHDITVYARGRTKITDKDLALWLFFVFAFVDAGTNVLWLYDRQNSTSTVANGDSTRKWIVGIFGYSAMVLVVLVEEALGIVLSLWANTFGNLQEAIHTTSTRQQSRNSRQSSSRGREYSHFDESHTLGEDDERRSRALEGIQNRQQRGQKQEEIPSYHSVPRKRRRYSA